MKFVFVFCVSVVTFLVACTPSTHPEKPLYTEVELGKALFFDSILSRDTSLSCASCHIPEFAFADPDPFSKGVFNQRTGRNTPSAMNLADRNHYFWDGRAPTLEVQALGPIESTVEMDLPLSSAVRRLTQSPHYKAAFYAVYGKAPSVELLGRAIAAYENTLETSNSPFDNYMNGKDTTLMSEAAKRGQDIFNGKGKCFDCHFGVDFTGNDKFKNIGLYNGTEKEWSDEGRYLISGNVSDKGKFKTPGLRNIAITAPYMHNGKFKTLMEVIEFYNEPNKFVKNAINRDTLLNKPLGLTNEEKKDLEAFLLSLTDASFLKK
jgi:cytochrome c peroxidase